MRILRALLLLAPLLLLTVAPATAASAHYVPRVGDRFDYSETVLLASGTGNYSSYYENTVINGSVWVTGVAPNGTESASYYNADLWDNGSASGAGSRYQWTSSGSFTFSATTFLYVQGTDNQTGYTNPNVWFYIDNALPKGGAVTLLNTPSTVQSTNFTYYNPDIGGSPSNHSFATIFTQGTGSFERNDEYGVFSATYTWQSFFDPSTGYIVGYLYTEQDSNSAGDGFAISDNLEVTQTTYPLTPAATSSSGQSSPAGISDGLILGVVVLVIVVVIILAVALYLRSRRRTPLPRHSSGGNVGFGVPPPMAPLGNPPPVHLTPSGQPAVQQIIVRETVKVACRYCGTLIDSTATVCPVCGAPRT